MVHDAGLLSILLYKSTEHSGIELKCRDLVWHVTVSLEGSRVKQSVYCLDLEDEGTATLRNVC